MRVMVIVKATKNSEAGIMPSEAQLTAMGAYNEALAGAGILQSGEGLQPSAQGKRIVISSEARTVTDGPFDTTSELAAGFWIWKVTSMEEAIAWAKRCPDTMPGEESVLELRPLFEMEDFGDDMTPELRTQEQRLRDELPGQGGPSK